MHHPDQRLARRRNSKGKASGCGSLGTLGADDGEQLGFTGLGLKVGPRLRDCFRQGQAEVITAGINFTKTGVAVDLLAERRTSMYFKKCDSYMSSHLSSLICRRHD